MIIPGGNQITKLFLRLQSYYSRNQVSNPREQARKQFLEGGRDVIEEIGNYAREHPEEIEAATRSMMYFHGSTPIDTIIGLMNAKLRIVKKKFRHRSEEVMSSSLLDIIDNEKIDKLPTFVKERLNSFRKGYLEIEQMYLHS